MVTNTIFTPEGSVYLLFPPSVPSPADLEGWHVHTVASADTRNGTFALVREDCESFNSLLRHVNGFERVYGRRADVTACVASGRAYRWTWEALNEDGTRQSDTVWASKIL